MIPDLKLDAEIWQVAAYIHRRRHSTTTTTTPHSYTHKHACIPTTAQNVSSLSFCVYVVFGYAAAAHTDNNFPPPPAMPACA